MSICWSCTTKQYLNSAVKSAHIRPQIRRQAVRLHFRPASTQTEQVHSSHSSQFIPIRERLAQWQINQEVHQRGLIPTVEVLGRGGISQYSSTANHGFDDEVDIDGFELIDYDGSISGNASDVLVCILQAGDLVELTGSFASEEAELAVFIRKIGDQIQLITGRGRCLIINYSHVKFTIPGWLDKSLLEPLLPHIPSEPPSEEILEQAQILDFSIPRDISAPVINALGSFLTEARAVYRRHASTLDNAFEELAHQASVRHLKLKHIAHRLIKGETLSEPALYAVRKALRNGGVGFSMLSSSFLQTHVVQVRSKEQTEVIDTAREWIREYRDGIASLRSGHASSNNASYMTKGYRNVRDFVAHARHLITESRKHREMLPNGLGPSNPPSAELSLVRLKSESFENHERILIKFMEFWCLSQLLKEDQQLYSLPAVILNATKMYPNSEFVPSTGSIFLQEIGAVPPYVNRYIYSQDLLLPSFNISADVDELYQVANILQYKHSTKEDRLSQIRHDWGNLRVFCIDPDETHEVDDGFSVEGVPGEPEHYWLRIHLANPTAFLRPKDAASRLAEHLSLTFYAPDLILRMLPRNISKTCSVQRGGPTITVSAKIDKAGQILETDIRPSIVHEVLHMTYEDLATALNEPSQKYNRLVLDGHVSYERETPVPLLSQQDLDDLALIKSLVAARELRREGNGAAKYATAAYEIEIHTSNGHDKLCRKADPHRSCFLSGDPIIDISGVPMMSTTTFFSGMDSIRVVLEVMVLAGEAASRWAWERRIPIFHRGQATFALPEDLKQWRKEYENSMLNLVDQADSVSVAQLRMYTKALQMCSTPGYIGLAPSQHHSLGLSHYSKVTSPLRRYGDMVNHWQIQSALLEEARLGKSLVGHAGSRDFLTFKEDDLLRIVDRMHVREKLNAKAQRHCTEHWTAHFFFRAFYFNQARLPQTFKVVVTTPSVPRKQGHRGVEAKCVDHGVCFSMRPLGPEGVDGISDMQEFDLWEVVVDEVEIYNRKIWVTPKKLLWRASPSHPLLLRMEELRDQFSSNEVFIKPT